MRVRNSESRSCAASSSGVTRCLLVLQIAPTIAHQSVNDRRFPARLNQIVHGSEALPKRVRRVQRHRSQRLLLVRILRLTAMELDAPLRGELIAQATEN